MNHIYRLVFNPARSVRQVVPECAKGAGKGCAGTSVARCLLWLALAFVTAPAFAQGGGGGDVFSIRTGPRGTFFQLGGRGGSGADPAGGNGLAGPGNRGGGGGGGGVSLVDGLGRSGGLGFAEAEGGDGGSAGDFGRVAASGPVQGEISGTAGGDGGSSGYNQEGGGGGGEGGGGVLWRLDASTSSTFNGTAMGAAGGGGGHGGWSVEDGGGWGGNGGSGGSGVTTTRAGALAIQANAVVQGGRGGNGGHGGLGEEGPPGGSGGQGGPGGAGLVLAEGSSATLSGTVSAGAGGSGGTGGDGSGNRYFGVGRGGAGGQGGVGLLASDAVVLNSGSITGGAGGQGGLEGLDFGIFDPSPLQSAASGAGGVGVEASNTTITNSGTIRGGLSGDGSARASAIRFTGGSNTLNLAASSTIVGAVEVVSGASATVNALASGVRIDDALIANGNVTVHTGGNAMTIAGHVSGSGALTKAGTGTLVLSGANTYTGGTTLRAGTLSIVSDANLGSASGALAFDGGVLLNTAVMRLSRQVRIDSGGATFQTDADLDIDQPLLGAGAWTKRGAGTLTLAGPASSHSSSSPVTIQQGRVRTAGANTLSASSAIAVAGGASLDLDGNSQIVASLAGEGEVRLGAGTLTTGSGSSTHFAGTISGAGGRLVKSGSSILRLSGVNTYSGGTALKGGRLDLASDAALGTGALAMDPGTTLGFAADDLVLPNDIVFTGAADPAIDTGGHVATLGGVISGPGDLTKLGSGTLVLAGANTYAGGTDVSAGTLRAGAADAFSPASAHSVAAGATLDLAGRNQRIAALNNSGTVSLVGAVPGTTLTVNGPYAGNNGMLRLGTALGDSGSASDRLVLSGPGATASGRTTVQVVNLGGLGAPTSGNGIEVISALNGATTTAQTTRDAFALAGGHVDAGAFEYRLHAADAAGAGENWYLRTTTSVVVPPLVPVAPGEPSVPAVPAASEAAASAVQTVEVPAYRVEVPLLSALPAQLRLGDLAMLGNLHQRSGDGPVGERRAWGRVIHVDQGIRQNGTVRPASEGRRSGFQAGTDLYADTNWRAGLHVGQFDGDMRVSGFASGIDNRQVGRNDLRSRYLGGYATWHGDNGLYADAVLQAGRHRYEAQPLGGLTVRGEGRSMAASIEVGKSFALADGWQVEPQLQLVHQRMRIDDASIPGAHVQQDSSKGWLVRAGVRVKGEMATGAGKLQPYARFNLYRSSNGNDVTRFSTPAATTRIAGSAGGSAAEVAGGFTLALGDSTSLYGELGKQWAAGGQTRVKSSAQASLGLRISW